MKARTGAQAVELLTTEEVAALFDVAPATAGRWGRTGRLVTVQTLGGRRRFFGAEVRALLAGESRAAARKLGLEARAKLTGGLA